MKYSLTLVAAALCLTVQSAQAQTTRAELQQATAATQEKPAVAQQGKKYGIYQLNTELVAVPQALANRAIARQEVANMTLVERNALTDPDQYIDFRRNAVVQNAVTGEMGVVTGNISVLSQNAADVQSLLQQFNLKVVRSAAATGIYIVQPNQDVELLQLLDQIKQSGLVKTARLDILEKRYSNQ